MAKARSWIRLYTDVPDHPKCHRLSDAQFRFWVNCICLAGRSDSGILPEIDDIAFHVRMPAVRVMKMRKELVDLRFLEEESLGIYRPHNFASRQFEESTSANRMRKFRDRRKEPRLVTASDGNGDVTLCHSDAGVTKHRDVRDAQHCSVSVSVSDSVSVSVSEKKSGLHFNLSDWFEAVYLRHPKKSAKALAEHAAFVILERCQEAGNEPAQVFAEIARVHVLWCKTEDWRKSRGQFCPKLGLWLEDEGYRSVPEADPTQKIWSDYQE